MTVTNWTPTDIPATEKTEPPEREPTADEILNTLLGVA